MKVYIYSPQIEIAELISDHLQGKGHNCIVVPLFEDLIPYLGNLKKLPDLLIMDYMSFNHESFNFIQVMKEKKLYLPVVFYNDPVLLKENRIQHWITQINQYQCIYEKCDLTPYEPIFTELQNLIEAPEVRPFISLINPPVPLPDVFIKNKITLRYIKENQNDCIFEFKERVKLSESLFYLLKIFQENRNKTIRLFNILETYKKDNKAMSESSLKVLISRLRSSIRKDKECKFLICNEKKGYRFVVYRT